MKKHIVCFGDSNTHGYCEDVTDSAEGELHRFNEDERWTCLLQKALGEDYLVLEEGLSGRTTAFSDPIFPGLNGLEALYPCLLTHEPVSLLIIMLGTNDTKERFSANAFCIGMGMRRLVERAQTTLCWAGGKPNILIMAPPPIGDEMKDHPLAGEIGGGMGQGCVEKSKGLAGQYELVARETGCHFLDVGRLNCPFNKLDFMHLTRASHAALAGHLAGLIPTLV